MADAERDDAPTTPPRAIRPTGPASVSAGEPSGFDVPVSDLGVTDLSVTELSVVEPARNPDTLMSLPKPAPSGDLPAGDRLRDIEDRLDAVDARLRALERMKDPVLSGKATPWWFWVLFLVGLAVTWRLLAAFQ